MNAKQASALYARKLLAASNLVVATMATLFAAGAAYGQMVPLEDLREDYVEVFYGNLSIRDFQSHLPPVPFAYWEDYCTALAEQYEPCENPPPDQCLVGHCDGLSSQLSEFFPAAIQLSGVIQASWGIPPSGLWNLGSTSGFKFRLDNTVDYDLFILVDEADSRFDGFDGGGVELTAHHSGGSTDLYWVTNGQLQDTGRLGPGTYTLRGVSRKTGTLESFAGLAYSAQWLVHEPQAPAIGIQPSDRSTACGGTVVLSVGTALAQSNYTFQWRRNFVPLTNGPNVMGATSSTLTLTNVCSGGDYDVVVTGPNPAGGGTIAEPSRLAQVTIISSPTGVETEPQSPSAAAVRAPAPNPFRISTTVAYEVSKPTRLVATVYNASGARVRSITDRTVSGPGSVVWDGCLRSGARAPVGIYFVRVELDDVRQTRKVVLLD